jgi:hypothetical protein
MIVHDIYEFNSKDISEISALAYDNNMLYALSDYGVLHHFKIKIKNFKIKKLKHLKSYKIDKEKVDSEGMFYHDKHLYISFEREPKIVKYKLNGKKKKKIKIDKKLQNIQNYKSKNKSLEAVAYSKKFGITTAPEIPLKGENYHTLYTKKGNYKFKQSGGITSLEFIDKNKLLILERKLNKITFSRTITLSSINLKNCVSHICEKNILKTMNNYKDKNVQNYEGLTKIGKNLYLMVSDDNGSMFQKTLFVLFEIKN